MSGSRQSETEGSATIKARWNGHTLMGLRIGNANP
jgi:hypothetical protein